MSVCECDCVYECECVPMGGRACECVRKWSCLRRKNRQRGCGGRRQTEAANSRVWTVGGSGEGQWGAPCPVASLPAGLKFPQVKSCPEQVAMWHSGLRGGAVPWHPNCPQFVQLCQCSVWLSAGPARCGSRSSWQRGDGGTEGLRQAGPEPDSAELPPHSPPLRGAAVGSRSTAELQVRKDVDGRQD